MFVGLDFYRVPTLAVMVFEHLTVAAALVMASRAVKIIILSILIQELCCDITIFSFIKNIFKKVKKRP